MEEYDPENNSVFNGALALRNFYGKFPENIELIAILRNIYGQDFIDIFEKSLENIEENFTEHDKKLIKNNIDYFFAVMRKNSCIIG